MLFEVGFETLCDKVLVVYTPANLALSRLMERNKLSKEEASKRLESQMDIELKKQRADFVIDNSGSPENTKQQVMNLLQNIV
ncbi:MAG: Dephospho-CoA kinase [uncultured bacterium]|nr:MAG: Dephospho-CoA kinase [uncultured bacterium]